MHIRRLILRSVILGAAVLLSTNLVLASSSDSDDASNDANVQDQANKAYNSGLDHMGKARGYGQSDDSAFAYNYRATSNAKAKREFEKAVSKFQQATTMDSRFVAAYNNLGYCLRKLDRLDESLAAYTEALSLDSTYAQAHEYLGELYLAMDQTEKAEKELAMLVNLKSPYADTLRQSIDIYRVKLIQKQMDGDTTAKK